MITERYEIFSVEVGDTVIVQSDYFVVIDSEPAEESGKTVLTLRDEEGYTHTLTANDFDKIRVVCD